MRENATTEENAETLAAFLQIPSEKAAEIAGTHYLFSD